MALINGPSCAASASLLERKPCKHTAFGRDSCDCGPPDNACRSRRGVGLSMRSATDITLLTFEDSLRAKEIKLSESKPASSKVVSISMGPAISSTMLSNHPLKSPMGSSSEARMNPPSLSHSSREFTGSQRGSHTQVASGQSSLAIVATAPEAVRTMRALGASSSSLASASCGTQCTPPAPSSMPYFAFRACEAKSAGGRKILLGRAGCTATSSTDTRILPMWTPLAKKFRAPCRSDMGKVLLGSRGRPGISAQTSCKSLAHFSGRFSMSTSKWAAEKEMPFRNWPRPS
mmetsp:Transcript_108669/g.259399  ORF Transcript_108669/g.259399 Transcript_108669/m.259399 type:complete len:289 (-) Transcript_108669:1202-2068(-)